MDNDVYESAGLSEDDVACLRKIEGALPILADLSRADVLFYCLTGRTQTTVVAHARPHSVPPIYNNSVEGQPVAPEEQPVLFRALARGRYSWGAHRLIRQGMPVVQEVYPVCQPDGRVIGALSVEKTLIEHERHQRRRQVFRKALEQFRNMVLRGKLDGVEALSPFREHDGILVTDRERRIRYSSGVAEGLYRRLGLMEILPGKHLADVDIQDEVLAARVLEQGRCLEEEVTTGHYIWIRKAIPLSGPDNGLAGWRRFLPGAPSDSRVVGVMLTIHDATETRRKEELLRVQSALMQEIHHRVKNNLQTIVALMRMQARRVSADEARHVLNEAINRILSVANVHEFLSQTGSGVINIRDITQRILNQTANGVVHPEKNIQLRLEGPAIYLPAQQATSCALVINELVQNAIEHGYEKRQGGAISVTLQDDGDQISIEVYDDGEGLPADFDLNQGTNLGLIIVRTLVEADLKGHFELRSDQGVSAIVTFPKPRVGGE